MNANDPTRPTYAVVATPARRGAVATILVDGPHSTTSVAACFQAANGRPLAEQPIDRIVFGRWGAGGEELVVCRRRPDRVEIHCHGGSAAANAAVDELVRRGATAINWGDWLDASEPNRIVAEARRALAEARTERTALILLDQLHGALGDRIAALIDRLQHEQFAAAAAGLDELLARSSVGLHLTRPWTVALVGATNVGKSSLANRMVGYARSIVFDQPGTTRDWVVATTAIDGWPVDLVDTPGIRETSDLLEAEGIAASQERLAEADVVLLTFDVSQPWSADDRAAIEKHSRAIVVHNKNDLTSSASAARPPGIFTSAKTGESIDALFDAIARRLVSPPQQPGEPFLFTERQVELARRGRQAVHRGDATSATHFLSETVRGTTVLK